jgi:hypothetical protein
VTLPTPTPHTRVARVAGDEVGGGRLLPLLPLHPAGPGMPSGAAAAALPARRRWPHPASSPPARARAPLRLQAAAAAGPVCEWPAWQSFLRVSDKAHLERDHSAPTMESLSEDDIAGVAAEESLVQSLLRNAAQRVAVPQGDEGAPARTSFTYKGAVN